MKEIEFQDAIVDVARLYGWKVASFRTSQQAGRYMTAVRYDGVGYPDLTMVHPKGALIFAEIKAKRGVMSDPQLEWQRVLEECTEGIVDHFNRTYGVHYYLWKPADADEIMDVLSFGKQKEWRL